jgi:predicted transcriptional regulator
MSQFTAGELEVMQVLWQHGECKPAEIQEHHAREISNMALRSVLSVLVEKEHLSRRKVGRAYYYRARTQRQSALRKATRRMSRIFADGSPMTLIAEMIRSEQLSEEDLAELQRIASGAEPGARKTTPRKKRSR